MSIFVLSDLHLSTDSKTNKSMEVFGARWTDYTAKLEKNWRAVITDNDQLTYTLIVQNLGNVPIVATDGVIITDVFNPILSNITVVLNGTEIFETTGYTYNTLTGEFATVDGVITVPAATYTQDPITGAITTTPGVTVLTVTGTV